jgi:hypothetical protein
MVLLGLQPKAMGGAVAEVAAAAIKDWSGSLSHRSP